MWASRALLLIAVLAGGCGPSQAEVAATMEAGLTATNLAIATALVADEAMVHVHEAPDDQLRHGTSECGCPCTDRTGAPPDPFVMSLDYHDVGCIPDSGLVPTALSGLLTASVEGDAVQATLDGGVLSYDFAMSGGLDGTVDPATLEVDAAGSLALGDHAIDADLGVGNAEDVTLDGEVDADGLRVRLQGLVLPRDRIATPCARPSAGTVVISAEDQDDLVVDLATPGNGSVTATLGHWTSDAVALCSFRSDVM